MKRLTDNNIRLYLISNYGVVRHNCERLKKSCQFISRRYGCPPVAVFHFMIENEPIDGLNTHSYGFNTGFGRAIKDEFTTKYNSL
jgi:hypothetical protein